MIKFLCKTALTIGIAGLALEGVKRVLEKRDEANHANEDENLGEQFVTITPTASTQVEPAEAVAVEAEPAQEVVVEEEPVEAEIIENPVEVEPKTVEPTQPTEEPAEKTLKFS